MLMDLVMAEIDTPSTILQLREMSRQVRVVVLTSRVDSDSILTSISNGAWGYVLKDDDPGEWVSAVRAAARGEAALSPRPARVFLCSRRAGHWGTA
jgi:DNA-binding NarL/FixJ family response regulator